jgi:dTDP-4-amino-4,6-dideoxygalactose transaminase
MTIKQQIAPIPFNRPSFVGSELEYLHDALVRNHASSGGEYTRRCVELLRSALGASDVLLTTSCTDALEMCALLLEIKPGDVVVVPSFTFVSTAIAFARAGATIRFADIEPTTLGLDPASVACLLDERVRAVVPVHYAGIGCDMAGLVAVLPAEVDIIEDNAHGLFGTLGERLLGSLGRFSTLSFHETKNFSCGEGGALVLNRDRDIERAHNLLDKGTNRRSFLLGQVDKYTWIDTGSSFGLSDLLAAFLLGQLERRDEVLARREEVWRIYDERLRSVAADHGVRCMSVPPERGCSWHMYYLLLPDGELRASLLAYLAEQGVNATFHYVPLHSAPAAGSVTDRVTECPVTDDISSRLVRLPFHNALAHADQERVCSLVERWMSANLSSRG